ncbi:MAG: pyrroloquinoline quinone biosynthesis protein PqqB [Acidobacteria bacterium]|nr:MAG: pyrroloquinoline quinone biosynthesis protein PqqB [Acidobacteriota bacterium]
MSQRLAIFAVLLLSGLFIAADKPPATKVVVLGIAQDGGIPQIGCTQEICKTQHHFVSSLAILAANSSAFLIDATPDLKYQYTELATRYPQYQKHSLFDGILLTHAHMGHYTGLMYLGKESISTHETPVYASQEMAAFLKQNAPWSLLITNGNILLQPFRANQEIHLEGVSITPVPVPHRHEFTDTHGFLIRGASKSLLYIPDIDSWEPARDVIERYLRQADYALLDGTFFSGDELPGRNMKLVPHPTIQDSIRFLQSLQHLSTKIYFTHLNHTNPALLPDSYASKELTKAGYAIVAEWQEFEL